jgi:hypothetical protein
MRLLLGVIAGACFAAGPDPGRQIRDEIARVEKASSDARVRDMLKGASGALDAGRTWLALERLAQAMDFAAGVRASEAPEGLFEERWKAADAEVRTVDRRPIAGPAAVQALREVALARTAPLLDGARGFAAATGPKDGLFYLGQAIGEADFARFLSRLPLDSERRWKPRSMLTELMAIQEKANAAFRPPASIDQHPRFIALNSAIKFGRELDGARSYHGALLQYLESVRQFGMLDRAPVAEGERAKVLARLKAVKPEESIAALLAQRGLAWAEHGDPDEWRAAAVIGEQVLPAYAAAMKGPARMTRQSGKTVEVTLVRWPYT